MRKFLLGYMSRTPFHCPKYLSITLLVSFLKSWTSWSWREKSACWLSLLEKSVLNFPSKKQQGGQGLRNISFQILVWEGQLYFPVPLHHFLTVCSLSASSHSKATFHLQYWEACTLCQFSSHENSDGVEVEQEGKGQSSLQLIWSMQTMPVWEEAALWEDCSDFSSTSSPLRLCNSVVSDLSHLLIPEYFFI